MSTAEPLEQVPTLSDDLQRVEKQLGVSVASDNKLLADIASHLIAAGGKRVRPGFCITAAAVESPEFAPAEHDVILGAVAVELVHQGSLYHDDVMDGATTRRSVESVNSKWGNQQAILAGDFLLGRASEIAASLGTEIAGLLASTISSLCDGQIRELEYLFNTERTVESYFASIDGKTASLLSAACRIGGITGGLDRTRIDALTTFGSAYGLAFQIVDDILDLTATDEQLGKPAGNDLIEGVYTLPTIEALADPRVGPELHELLGLPLDLAGRDRARDLIRTSGALQSAHGQARKYAQEAKDSLSDLGTTAGGVALGAAADHLIGRVERLIV